MGYGVAYRYLTGAPGFSGGSGDSQAFALLVWR